jgi:hypothetical protein
MYTVSCLAAYTVLDCRAGTVARQTPRERPAGLRPRLDADRGPATYNSSRG